MKSRFRPNGFVNRSPTESLESRKRWAEKERQILYMNHRSVRPTHEAVAKFRRPVTVAFLKLFLRRVRQSLASRVKSRLEEFAVYLTLEIEPNNCVHYHFLIRTSVQFPREVLGPIIKRASDGFAALQHCEAINDVEAISRYVVTDLHPDHQKRMKQLLFKPDLGLHFSGSWNGYFVKSKGQLWDDWKRLQFGSRAIPSARRRSKPSRFNC